MTALLTGENSLTLARLLDIALIFILSHFAYRLPNNALLIRELRQEHTPLLLSQYVANDMTTKRH